jgi:hypothetical protein
LRRVQEAHEDGEHLPVRQQVQRVAEALVSIVRSIVAENIVRLSHPFGQDVSRDLQSDDLWKPFQTDALFTSLISSTKQSPITNPSAAQ